MTDLKMVLDYLSTGKYYHEIFNVSIDKVSMMGNWYYEKGLHHYAQIGMKKDAQKDKNKNIKQDKTRNRRRGKKRDIGRDKTRKSRRYKRKNTEEDKQKNNKQDKQKSKQNSSHVCLQKHPFQVLIDSFETPVSVHKGNRTIEIEGYIFDKIWFKTYDKQKNKYIRDLKIEFNPKRLLPEEEMYLKEQVLPLLKNLSFTRLDFAFDLEEDLSEYIYYDSKNPKKVGKYIAKNGKLESLYVGSKESEWHVCIYNKKKEKMKELLKEEKAQVDGKQYIADLTDWEREQLKIREHWWRVEVRVRGEKADAEISPEELFQNLHIIKPSFLKATRVQDQALIYFLMDFPEKIQDLNYKTKKRVQKLLLGASSFDVVNTLILVYCHKSKNLEESLKKYIASSHLREYEIDILYMKYEKERLQQGDKINPLQLTFASNELLKKHHKNRYTA